MGDDQSASDSGGSVRTFLIADVRGYTNYTHTFGDLAAAELTRRFAEVAATTVTAHGGELVETLVTRSLRSSTRPEAHYEPVSNSSELSAPRMTVGTHWRWASVWGSTRARRCLMRAVTAGRP